jgi:dienelactone hydrolase
MPIKKSEITLDVNGKPLKIYLASHPGDGPGVLVLPSWWGLKPFFKEVCDRLAELGYTALAPDYYGGRVGNTIDEAKELQQGVESDFDAMSAMIQAAKDHLVSLRPGQPIGIVGFSMGTDWAIITTAKEADVAATVLFYGGWSTDFSNMRSKVLGHYAETDEWVPFDQAQEMEQIPGSCPLVHGRGPPRIRSRCRATGMEADGRIPEYVIARALARSNPLAGTEIASLGLDTTCGLLTIARNDRAEKG